MQPEEYLAQIESLPQQARAGFKLGSTVKVEGEITKIMVSGMGGSAIPGSLLANYLDLKIPIFVNREYTVPAFVDSRTLFFAISYSGNTEETLEAVKAANRKNAKIVCLTSGGKLRRQAEANNWHLLTVPTGMQPRAGLPYLFFPMLHVLQNTGLLDSQEAEVESTADALNNPSYRKQAERLAGKLTDKIPVIYASERLGAIAYRWQTQFNENAKIHAFSHVFSELNHNQIVGFTKLNGNYHVIMLQDQDDHRRIKKRMNISADLISKKGVESTTLDFSGESQLTRIFSAVHVGDLTSYFLSQHGGIDPVPVEIIENLKKQMGPFA